MSEWIDKKETDLVRFTLRIPKTLRDEIIKSTIEHRVGHYSLHQYCLEAIIRRYRSGD